MNSQASSALKVWLLTNAPSPYQMEFLEALATQSDLELAVRFMRTDFRGQKVDISTYKFDADCMAAIGVSSDRDELRLHPTALRECWVGSSDVYVLSGLYTSPTFLACALCLALRRRRYVLWLERPSIRNGRSPFLKRLVRWPLACIRSVVLRAVFAGAGRVICIGSLAVEQYKRLTLAAKLRMVPYCSNTARFENPNADEIQRIESVWHLTGKFVFLYSGQLIVRKGVDTLLAAYKIVAEKRPDTALVLLGDGPLRSKLAEVAKTITSGVVVFGGHQPQELLPACFACGSVFVFPSRHDGWGVVINEAAASGLPIIASKQTGATHDLVMEGENGFQCDAENVAQFAERMIEMIDRQHELPSFASRSRELAARCSTEQGASDFAKILRDLVQS